MRRWDLKKCNLTRAQRDAFACEVVEVAHEIGAKIRGRWIVRNDLGRWNATIKLTGGQNRSEVESLNYLGLSLSPNA